MLMIIFFGSNNMRSKCWSRSKSHFKIYIIIQHNDKLTFSSLKSAGGCRFAKGGHDGLCPAPVIMN